MLIYDKLYPQQKIAVDWLKQRTACGLFSETGTGKTLMSLAWLANHLKVNPTIKRVYCICPTCKLYDWETEFKTYRDNFFTALNEDNIIRLDNAKKNIEILNNTLKTNEPHVFLISHTQWMMLYQNKQKAWFNDSVLLFDEASVLKSIKSKRTKMSLWVASVMNYQHAIYLTATPRSNSPVDVFPLLECMGYDFGYGHNHYLNFLAFKAKYCEVKEQKLYNQFTHQQTIIEVVVGTKNEPEMINLIHQKCYTLKLSDIIENLPDKSFFPVYLESPKYQTLSKQLLKLNKLPIKDLNYQIELAKANSDQIKEPTKTLLSFFPTQPITLMMYFRQLCSGFMYNSQIEDCVLVETQTPKLEALYQKLYETNENVIVFYNFQYECDSIKEMINKQLVDNNNHPIKTIAEINGNHAYSDALKIWTNEDGSIKKNVVILANYASGGVGINLDQVAHITIFYSPCLSSELWQQAEGRQYRLTQKHHCLYYDFLITNSIECEIYQALKSHQAYTQHIFEVNYLTTKHQE